MFEEMTFQKIMQRCLDRVSGELDKREGSVLYDALAPAAAELAILYIELGTLMDRAFPDTAQGIDLTKKALERGVLRQNATKAIRKGYLEGQAEKPFDAPVGARFSGGDLNFVITAPMGPGEYMLEAETPGSAGNVYFGPLFPIDFLQGLSAARLGEILIPGEEEESDASLRTRYYASINGQAFGGNQADYKSKAALIPGVGAVKVFPVWNGGGTVKIVFTDSEGGAPSPALVETVQNEIDPVGHSGQGLGLAPIGHVVTVKAAKAVPVDAAFSLTLDPGVRWENLLPPARQALQEYFDGLTGGWAGSAGLVVRLSQIETRILALEGVLDIRGTTINGRGENLVLGGEEIPALGEISCLEII